MILLVGLIVKNGIILLDFTRHRMIHEDEPWGSRCDRPRAFACARS
jgi:multidrug efflux pump subunit AcrB